MNHNAKSILGTSSFWVVNRKIAKHLKNNDAGILLSFLIDKEDYHSNRNELVQSTDDEGNECLFFFATSEKIEDECNIAYKTQKKCISMLENAGFIYKKLIGVPAKLHFTIRHNKICHFVTSSIAQTVKLDLPNGKDILRTNTTKNKKQRTNIYLSENEKKEDYFFEKPNTENQDLGNSGDLEKEKGSAEKEKEEDFILVDDGETYIENKDLPPDERRIQFAIFNAKKYFEVWPSMENQLRQSAGIMPDDKTFDLHRELEKWIRHNGQKIYILQNIEKNITSSFGSWLQNYKQFNRVNHGNDKKESNEIFSEEAAKRVFTNLLADEDEDY